MMMKQLFRQTATLLRTALLFGAVILVNTQIVKAQTDAQWAEMPDAFETIDPTTVDWSQEPYFFIQFSEGNVHSFLGEYGNGALMRGKDYVPFSKSIQWTLVPTGVAGKYYLKSQNGLYAYYPYAEKYCGTSSTIDSNTLIFTLYKRSDGFFDLTIDGLVVDGKSQCIGRENGLEWGGIRVFAQNSPRARVRFAKLKSNIAHIIYYREEHSDGHDNTGDDDKGNSPSNTETRHYLTYSGTGDTSLGTNWWESDVSSRQSIMPKDKSLWTLPTAAAYHLDGLWALQPADAAGNFYIKRYGTTQYLNEHNHDNTGIYDCALGSKDASKGIYTLENPTANRYTRIQNVKYTSESLTSDMFFEWNGYGADATKTSAASARVDLNLNTTLNAGGTVFGDSWHVNYLKYADLTGYKKMTITGTPDMQLRVLMDRVEPIPVGQSGYDEDGGAFVEKDVTIGRDGKAVVDLTDMTSKYGQATVKMTYINGSDDAVNTSYGEVTTAHCGWNKFSMDGTVNMNNKSYGRNYITYLQVDASAINGTIKRVTLSGDFETIADRALEYGVGYNNSTWSSDLTWNTADRQVTALGGTQWVAKTSGETSLSFDISDAFTDSKVKTILVYNFQYGGGYIKNPRVEVEYIPDDISLNPNYVHLNSIKVGGNSPSGTITGITLDKMSTDGNRYLHHAGGDGWQVLQWSGDDSNYWYAGFYPVEVVQTDEFYQVLLKVKKDDPAKIKLVGQTNSPTIVPYGDSTLDNLYGATFTPTANFTNVFQYKNMPTGCYEKIVIKFGSPVPDKWHLHTYGGQFDNNVNLSGLTEYEITLTGEPITDFTIFNWDTMEPITITECYFTPATPSCDLVEMLNYDGTTDAYSEEPGVRKLWHLEQVNDYEHFRLRAPTGQYFQADGKMTSNVNDAMIFTNTSLLEKFDLKWFYVVPEPQEIPVDKMVTHKMSYLKKYAKAGLDKQGLATDAQSDWWNYDQSTQKVNHFEITHYVKKNESLKVEFPTILNNSSDHIYYQRWYHYNDESCDNDLYPDGTDIAGLKSHVSLDTPENGDVKYYLYKNGIVTGERVYWEESYSKFALHANRNFIFTNSDGKAFTVAADVSRYSDMTYKNESSKLEDDLEEPSLTMRYVFYMKDAKEMAAKLTACTPTSGEWLEKKTFHFPAKQIFYENEKKAGYRGEFLGLRHVFSDYWVFNDGNVNSTDDNNLVSAVNDGNKSGKIEVEIVDDPTNPTGIRKGGYNDNASYDRYSLTDGSDADYKGFYFYDMMDFTALTQAKASYGDSRFIVFRYPASGEVNVPADPNVKQEAKINVYLNNNGTKYQLAQFTVIFDKGTVTLPYSQINSTSPYVQSDDYKSRDPKALVEKAGSPIAKVTFDYPDGETYHYPDKGTTRHDQGERAAGGTIDNSSPVPLTFDKTNYAFDGGDNVNWGSYALVSQKYTQFGNQMMAMPANDNTYGYGDASVPALQADKNLQKGFLYIDASEQPGDICSAPFVGDFCAGDKLMFSGWISGSNKAGGSDNRCPGGVTLTVKGEHTVDGKTVTETLYRFCPGQCYELDNGTGDDGSTNATHVVWQQFYFEFTVTDKYDRHWIEVNNNCVSSKGGDFMLDNIEVYCIVPEVIPDVNTPLCVSVDDEGNTVTDMRLLKLSVNYNKLKSSAGVASGTAELGFVFLEKDLFLKTFRTELQNLTDAEKAELHLDAFNFSTISLDALADAIEDGEFKAITGADDGKKGNTAYRKAFDAAILGDKKTYYTKNAFTAADKNASIIYFEYNSDFNAMEKYSFAKAVNKTHAVYREEVDGEKFIVMNGNYPEMKWKANTDYYILISNNHITTSGEPFSVFNLCSECNKASVFHLDPPYTILGMESSDETQEYEVCEGKIPTVLTDLKGYNLNGEVVPLKNINFDWWLGDMTAEPKVLATLENYHKQEKGGVRLDAALSALRAYYPDITSLDGVFKNLSKTPNLTADMVQYLQELVEKGQLILHQQSVNVPAQKVSDEDPYCYFVACPIHDGYFDKALNNDGANNVAYFCDEPQGLALKIGEKAPTLKTGFVPNENGFAEYNYPDGNPVLSIRLAKKAQFETVKHGETTEAPNDGSSDNSLHYLWLPVRNAEVQSTGSTGVIQKSDDYNVYLASTDDPTWDKEISRSMRQTVSSLPIVGKIVSLTAVNTKGQTNVDQTGNRLCIYFTDNFEVREGYSYTLSLPFKESPGENACDGTILINLKIVPDYEVWTGGADNTDWNNDQNWRRADGNLRASIDEPTAQSPLNSNELYRTDDLPATSPLKDYVTNTVNYRTPLDRILRKGFAPLYCTHILIKSNEWGNAPVLYDALDAESGNANLTASPFPNLRDTSTPILKFDMQARKYDIWSETYGSPSNKGRAGDLIAEMYQINSCDEIAFQPGAELLNAHLLNYNNAWVEYELNNNRWYLLGSPLQGTISGEWYAPSGTAQQKTTYYENVTFGPGYDRYSPAVFQRSWDKAKAVLYEVGSAYSTGDNPNDEDLGNSNTMPGSAQQGQWSGTTWDTTGADEYLDRLGYKPLGGNKVNVAIKGVWSNTYNDATVDYTKGGFSVLVKNDLKGNDSSEGKSIIRLPKEDTMYDYYKFEESGANDGGTDTNLSDVRTLNRAKNRGRLKTDLLLPASAQKTESAASRYGDQRTYTRVPTQLNADTGLPIDGKLQSITETVAAGISNMGYYLVENPFPCGLDMGKFFAANTGLQKKYWLLTPSGQQLVQMAGTGEWITQDGTAFSAADAVLAPGQGFFVQATTAGESTGIQFTDAMQAQTRFGKKSNEGTSFTIVVGTKQKMTTKTETITMEDNSTKTVTVKVPVVDASGNYELEDITEDITIYSYVQDKGVGKEFPLKTRGESAEPILSGLVITAERGGMQSSALVLQRGEASNDFLPEEDTEVFLNSDLVNAPTVYTLCGRLATTINTIHDFSCLPLGVESASDAPCTLTFQGVEMLADSVALYDAVEQKLTKLESGMTVSVSGQTQNRYYLLGGMPTAIEAAEATHLQIFTEGRTATVIASTTEPLLNVRCYDMAGQLVYSASPQSAEHSFSLPIAGVYIIEAETEHDRKTMKVVVR